jgi:hypothetical protein
VNRYHGVLHTARVNRYHGVLHTARVNRYHGVLHTARVNRYHGVLHTSRVNRYHGESDDEYRCHSSANLTNIKDLFRSDHNLTKICSASIGIIYGLSYSPVMKDL